MDSSGSISRNGCYNVGMFSFGRKNSGDVRIGAVVDIGSASVAAAIVASKAGEKFPEVIWTEREYLPESKKDSEIEKRLYATIVNVFMELGASGLRALQERYPRRTPSLTQISIAAPFAYTIARHINVRSEKPFRVTDKLLREMEQKAALEADEQTTKNALSRSLDLQMLDNATFSLAVNGYLVHDAPAGPAREVSLSQLVTLTDTALLRKIKEASRHVLPGAMIDADSFMSLFLRALVDLSPSVSDACLVSVTAEATEMMVLSDGLPLSSSFVRVGQYSLARDIAAGTKLPFGESLGVMRENGVDSTMRLNESSRSAVAKVISAYEEKLTALFRGAGGTLSLPKNIYLHTDLLSESFFSAALAKAASAATGLKHRVIPITSEFFDFGGKTETAILSSAYVFHKKLYEDDRQIRPHQP